jgi:hypothetical protein
MQLKSMGILGAIFAMALSTRSTDPRSRELNRSSRTRNQPDVDKPCFGDKLARKALKGRIGTCHGTGYVASKAAKKRRNAIK